MTTWNTIILLLSISLLINILFVWYLRQLLGRFAYICTNIYELKQTIDLYMKHLEIVSELEMFYKDPHIEKLMQHTADLVEQLETYEEFYNLLVSNDIANIPSKIEGTEQNEQTINTAEEADQPKAKKVEANEI